MSNLSGQCAIITGASRGIGAAAAKDMASKGMSVVLAARSIDDCEAVAQSIRADGGKAVAVKCDVRQYADLQAAVEQAQASFGRLDVLVNNAGTIDPIAHLAGAASNALEGWSHYCATKAGVLSLTKCVHKEYSEHGIRCIGMSPGTVATDMQLSIKDSGIGPVSKMAFSDHSSRVFGNGFLNQDRRRAPARRSD